MKKILKSIKKYGLILVIGFIIYCIWNLFYNPDFSDLHVLVMLGLWICIIYLYNLQSTATLKLVSIYVVLLSGVYTFFQISPSLERLATMLYLFLCLAIIQLLLKFKKSKG